MKKSMRLLIASLIVLVALSLLAINTGHAQVFVCPPTTPMQIVRPPVTLVEDVRTLPNYIVSTPITALTPVFPPAQVQTIPGQVYVTPGQVVLPPAQHLHTVQTVQGQTIVCPPGTVQDARFITCPSPGATIVCPPLHTTPGQVVYPPAQVHTTPGQVVLTPAQIQTMPAERIYPATEPLVPGQVYAPAPVNTPIVVVRQPVGTVQTVSTVQTVGTVQQPIVLAPTPGQIVCPPGATAPISQCIRCPTPGATVVCPPAQQVLPPTTVNQLCPPQVFAPATLQQQQQLIQAAAPHYRTASLCPPGTIAANTGDLTIRIRDFHRARGQAIVALFNAEDGFPYDLDRAAAITTVPVTDARDLSITFPNVPHGLYAVSVFHDETMMNRIFLDRDRSPLIGTGFHNWRIGLGDPRFIDTRFVVNSPTEFVLVNMHYPEV
jgi:uncharacterized protein (DUF2141 family)